MAGGQWPARDIPVGKNIPLGKIAVDLSELPCPAACQLVVGLRGWPVENDWNFWLYPGASDAAAHRRPPASCSRAFGPRPRPAWPPAAKSSSSPAGGDLDPGKSPR